MMSHLSKVTLLKAMTTSSQYDAIRLSEIYLDSAIKRDDKRLYIEGYNIIRADHPGNKKGVEHVTSYRGDNLFMLDLPNGGHLMKILQKDTKINP